MQIKTKLRCHAISTKMVIIKIQKIVVRIHDDREFRSKKQARVETCKVYRCRDSQNISETTEVGNEPVLTLGTVCR